MCILSNYFVNLNFFLYSQRKQKSKKYRFPVFYQNTNSIFAIKKNGRKAVLLDKSSIMKLEV